MSFELLNVSDCIDGAMEFHKIGPIADSKLFYILY